MRSSLGPEEDNDSNESQDSNAQLMADLKEQVERAEQASEQYRKQLELLQQRLDEATDQQTAAEEHEFAARTQIDKLAAEARETARQRREEEINHESERNALLQETGRASAREHELQATVKRLTDSLQMKTLERANHSRMNSMGEPKQEVPTPQPPGQDDMLQVLQDKDAAIDALKLELADIHLKVAEQEHLGDGRLQALEKQLSDIKMQNARLVEENDSFQMLLIEKTSKGDFLQHDTHSDSGHMSSLAEELEEMGENDEVSFEQYKKVEAESRKLKDENKALTLYIDKIIGRLLSNPGYEHIITGKDADEVVPSPPPKPAAKEKPLPLAPAAPIANQTAEPPGTPTVFGGFLQRAKSVVNRAPAAKPARPMSYIQPQLPLPSANENPETAPKVPFNRGHRRARSDQTQPPDLGAAAVVQQMNKGSPLRTASGSQMSPGISPLQRAQTSYFAPPQRSDTVRASSQSGTAEPGSSANSIASGESLERQSTEATSAQTSTHTGDHRHSMAAPVTAGVMKQNQLRPLRLVQNQDEEERKKNNRQSWMGNWFARASVDGAAQQ